MRQPLFSEDMELVTELSSKHEKKETLAILPDQPWILLTSPKSLIAFLKQKFCSDDVEKISPMPWMICNQVPISLHCIANESKGERSSSPRIRSCTLSGFTTTSSSNLFRASGICQAPIGLTPQIFAPNLISALHQVVTLLRSLFNSVVA
jgi:hypothetical protein